MEDQATASGNMHKNLAKFGRVVFELRERTDGETNKQTDRPDRQTDVLITILRTRAGLRWVLLILQR